MLPEPAFSAWLSTACCGQTVERIPSSSTRTLGEPGSGPGSSWSARLDERAWPGARFRLGSSGSTAGARHPGAGAPTVLVVGTRTWRERAPRGASAASGARDRLRRELRSGARRTYDIARLGLVHDDRGSRDRVAPIGCARARSRESRSVRRSDDRLGYDRLVNLAPSRALKDDAPDTVL